MAATPKQIAANRLNAMKSTGPRTEEGKKASRRNALKHGLTGRGVVIPGEDEHEVTIRVKLLEDQLVPEGDVVAALLVRQMAINSIRVERAFRHESALAADRMRRAEDAFDDDRKQLAETFMDQLAHEPATARRRLMMGAEGIDALIARLLALREKTEPRTFIAWDDQDGEELERCLGRKPGQVPATRAAMLSKGVVYDYWVGLDPAEHEGMTDEGRTLWAVGEIHTLITAEVAALEAHRATLDPARVEAGRAEAAERELLDLGKDGQALRRYAGAAERAVFRALKDLRGMRSEAQARAVEPAELGKMPTAAATVSVAEVAASQPVRGESGSYCPAPSAHRRPGPGSVVGSILDDLKASYVPIAVGRAPRMPVPPAP